ncbi:HalOD1 output domain-containing protein [Natrinema sp. LN54]|uniref:HalOD1 output domain-containing protein n=1 Tax=Natrinema sp. LN54 TaxID=3458705 RepID=UPI004035013D
MSTSFNKSSGDDVYESVSIAVVTAVATHRGADPAELPPLYEWIDPDALDSIFAPTRRGGSRGGRLEFTYDGHAITVDCTDGVAIEIDDSPVARPVVVDSEPGSLTNA